MSNFTYPPGTPTGTVPLNYVLPSPDWEHTIRQVFKAPNFTDGGTYAPGAFITVGGSGFQFTGTAHSLASSARLNVESSAEIRIKTSGLLKADGTSGDIKLEVTGGGVATLTTQANTVADLYGATNIYGVTYIRTGGTLRAATGAEVVFESGSTLELETGSNMSVSGDVVVTADGAVTFQSGSNVLGGGFASWTGTWWFSGEAAFVAGTWPQLDPDRGWERRRVSIAMTTYDTTAEATFPDGPHIWTMASDQSTAPMLETSYQPGEWLLEFEDLPIGGTISQVQITTRGVGEVTTSPTYRIAKWQSGASGLTYISDLETDGHTDVNWDVSNVTTTITADEDTTVESGWRYGLFCTGPSFGIEPGSAMKIYECVMSGTATSIQL